MSAAARHRDYLAIAFPLTVALAGLSHRLVERPFLRLGERFRAPR